ncbi:hypothetical protein LINGRAHAP2_LOCUS8842 [Linum grandiflorum]
MIPLLVLFLLAIWCCLATSTLSHGICSGPYGDNLGTIRCNPTKWGSSVFQERVLETFKYDVFKNTTGFFCVPFNIETGMAGQTRTVYSYFSCSYAVGRTDNEEACNRCRVGGIKRLRTWCPTSYGAVYNTLKCCLRYETYNMCNTTLGN